MPLNQRRRQLLFFSLLPLAFLFRLFVGLCSQFRDPDTKQTYLLGLKFSFASSRGIAPDDYQSCRNGLSGRGCLRRPGLFISPLTFTTRRMFCLEVFCSL